MRVFGKLSMLLVGLGVIGLVGCDSGGGSLSAGSGGEPRLSFSVAIESGSRSDQDTALHLRELGGSTDEEGEVQEVSLAGDFRLGGYVSAEEGTYSTAELFSYPEDAEDVYALAMLPGESIRVRLWEGGIARGQVNDHTFDSSGICVTLHHLDSGDEDEDCRNADEREVTADSEGRYHLTIQATSPDFS